MKPKISVQFAEASVPMEAADRVSTDAYIAGMIDRTDQMHKQLCALADRLGMVLAEERAATACFERPESSPRCFLHERLASLQDSIISVQNHIHSIIERVEL